ncbi:MAG: IS110 family transposase, partial [Candidatus Binatia bacterium]
MEMYVGLDVHSKSSVFVIQDADGELVGRGEVPTSREGFERLCSQYALPAGTKVALETGTVAFFVARELSRLRLDPVVVDAHEVRLKAHRPMQKSDRRDALELCEGIRRNSYRTIVHVPPLEIGQLRETLSRRRHFVRLATAETNAAKRLLRSVGLGQLGRSLGTEVAWEKLEKSLKEKDQTLAMYVGQHRTVWQSARDQVKALEQALEVQRAPFAEQLERLQTVPGVGPIVATTAVAVFSDVSRFPTAKHAASYGGLVPSTHQSGDRDRHGKITKKGSGELRAMLCEAAHHASRPTNPLNPYFRKLCAKHGYRMAVIAVAHRLCRILYSMMKNRSDFDVAKLGVEKGP